MPFGQWGPSGRRAVGLGGRGSRASRHGVADPGGGGIVLPDQMPVRALRPCFQMPVCALWPGIGKPVCNLECHGPG